MTMRATSANERTVFSDTRKLALNALNYAARYQMPPVPRIYEVWFTYVSGHNPALNARIDMARRGQGGIDPRTIEQVYHDHLSPHAMGGAVAEIGSAMTDRLAEATDTMNAGLHNANNFAEALDAIGDGLGPGLDAETMVELIGLLRDVAGEYAVEARQVSKALAATRAEVAQLQQQMRELRESEYLDHLTRLPNRDKFEEVLGRSIDLAEVRAEPLCIALADVDQLAALNTAWGRASGDFVLRSAADVLREGVKGRDLPAHFEGGTFGLVLPNTELAGAHTLGEQIRRSFARMTFKTADTDEPIGRVTMSLGITQLRGGEGRDMLIERAAIHLALAKRAGRDQCWTAA